MFVPKRLDCVVGSFGFHEPLAYRQSMRTAGVHSHYISKRVTLSISPIFGSFARGLNLQQYTDLRVKTAALKIRILCNLNVLL